MPLITGNQITPGRWYGDIKPFTRIRGKKFILDKAVLESIKDNATEDLLWLKDTFGFEFCNRKKAIESSQESLFNEDAISSIALTFFEEIQFLNANLFLEKGRHALTKKEYLKAIAYLEKAVSCKPDLPGPHYYLSKSLKKIGRIDEALEEAKKAIDKEPENQKFQTYYKQLLNA